MLAWLLSERVKKQRRTDHSHRHRLCGSSSQAMVTWLKAVASCRFLFNMGQAKSRAYIINGLAMLASFFLFRNVLGVGVAPVGSGCDELPC